MELEEVLHRITAVTIPKDAAVTQLRHEEDNAPYQVWRIDAGHTKYILKAAKGQEAELYCTVPARVNASIPALYQIIPTEEQTYLLLEYVEGEDLCRCDRRKLTKALDALITLQQQTWEMEEKGFLEGSFEISFQACKNRGAYLNHSRLEDAYEKFLEIYQAVPRSLGHNDLLPFNVISGKDKGVLIDWECGGILPYPTAFARLIAHGEEVEDSLFYMTEADKAFAVDYYYDHLLKDKGISYTDWRNTLEYFLFYEYCEWVFVGNKYGATDGAYYQKYLPMALQQAQKLLQTERK